VLHGHRGMVGSMAVAITRRDLSAREFRAAAAKAKDAKAARRMPAIAAVPEGDRAQDRHRELRDGPENVARLGLSVQRRRVGGADEPPLGRACATIEPGPKGGTGADGAGGSRPCRRRGGALAAHRPAAQDQSAPRRRHAQAQGGQAAGRARFRRLPVRPQHPKSDPAAQEAFRKTSPRP